MFTNMCSKLMPCLMLLSMLHLQCNAFWWPRTTTEAPPQTVIKEIPLTYFRTYTYQPLSSNAFQLPYFTYSGMVPPQSGMHSRPRYDPYTATFLQPLAAQAQLSNEAALEPISTTTSTTPAPTTTSTTTTTTTTTTPAPTTTTTTTTAPSTTTTAAKGADSNNAAQYTTNFEGNINGEYPTFNRRLYNQANIYRAHYPYPEYYSYNPAQRKESGINTNFAGARAGQVQFVPCMCPVNMGVTSGIPLTQPATSSVYLAQSRSSTGDDESDMTLPGEQNERKIKITLEPLEQTEQVQPTAKAQENFTEATEEEKSNAVKETAEVSASQQTTHAENH